MSEPAKAGSALIEAEEFDELRTKRLTEGARKVLQINDAGGWTRAAPDLYPHQWSWDSAFISMGLGHIDTHRAVTELDRLLAAQWRTGMIPHIVFDPAALERSYFPGPGRWECSTLCTDAPEATLTSGICQPPVHAIAAQHIWEIARRRGASEEAAMQSWLEGVYPRLLAWHRYLVTKRDPEGSGLTTIYHPWESGCDNSPRWDYVMGELIVGSMPAYTRYDLGRVGDPSERPSDDEYDYYVWLVESLKRAHYRDETIHEQHPFLVKDVLFSALLVAANAALLEMAEDLGASQEDRETLQEWIERGRTAIRQRSTDAGGYCYDFDVHHDMELRSDTIACYLAPLIAGGLNDGEVNMLLSIIDSPTFLGHPGLCRPLPASTSPHDPGFRPRSYWRGPVWPVVSWLLWWSLKRAGREDRATKVRDEALTQIDECGFWEYFEPFSSEGLGSDFQSWTAAVVLDWLAERSDAVIQPDDPRRDLAH